MGNSDVEQEIRELVACSEIEEIQLTLGLSPLFMQGLVDEASDWSFVIKMAVVVEAALAQTIASAVNSGPMQAHLARLSLDGRTGKIQLARDMGLVGPRGAARLRAIASIRNAFAHDIAVVGLSLGAYVSGMDAKDGADLANTLLAVDGRDTKSSWAAGFPAGAARFVLWVGACLCLVELGRAYRNNGNAQRWRDARVLMGEAFLAEMQGAETDSRAKLKKAKALLERTAATQRNSPS